MVGSRKAILKDNRKAILKAAKEGYACGKSRDLRPT
jgi:hypothetical protein